MSKFPRPVQVPNIVYEMRNQRHQQVLKAAKLGVLIRLLIVSFELIGVWWTYSSALFTDAVASVVDVVSTIFLIVCVRLAQRPPDEDHPFGHGRYEPLGGLLLGLLLAAMGGVMLVQGLLGVAQQENYEWGHPFAWIFAFVSMILLEMCYRLMIKTAKKENSPALVADAVHYRIDSITSLLATITLIIAAYFPNWGGFIDHAGAVLIALFMVGLGLYASRENFHQIMDKVPETSFFNQVKKAAEMVKGVRGTEKIRIQSYGPDAHVDIDIEVEPQLTVDVAHRISQQVRVEIQKAWPAVRDVTVHIEPYYANDH